MKTVPETLLVSDAAYQGYKHRQWGVEILLVGIVIVFMFFALYGFTTELAVLVSIGFTVVCAICFSSMTIEVDRHEVIWFFGFGLGKKSLPLEEIESCKSVKNSLWLGLGVHSYGTGWIYNISGLLGVEIELKSGASIRLGSNQPNYLVAAIERAKAQLD